MANPISPISSTNTTGVHDMTTITTEANLTSDPDIRYTKTGQPVCHLSLAVSARRKALSGEYVDTPVVFWDATCWNVLAEHAADSLHKGDRVLVHGTGYDEDWTDRDGNTRTKHVLQITALGASLRYATAALTRAGGKIPDAAQDIDAAAVVADPV
jgi:single-strand DNA-binding protein